MAFNQEKKEKTEEICRHTGNGAWNFLVALGLNLGIFSLIYMFCGFHYELSDDWFFSMNIAEGYYDFTFCSYFVQILSVMVQKLIAPLNAYMVLQLIFGFIALTTLAYIFLDTFGRKKGFLLSLFILSAFGINMYSLITFTKTAAILVLTGGLVLFWAHCQKKRWLWYAFGVFLAVLGRFYRLQIFYSVAAVFAFFVLGWLIHETKDGGWKEFFRQILSLFRSKLFYSVLILLVLVFSGTAVSRNLIYHQEGMSYYREYNELRSSVVDFQIPDLEEEPEKYGELGISENDIEMIRNWYLDDQGMADVDTLKEITQLQEGRQTEQSYLVNMIKSFMGMAELLLLAVFFLTIAGVLLVYQKRSFAFLIPIVFSVGLLYGYLFLIGRCNYRSVFSIWFSATVCILYSLQFLSARDWVKKKKQGKKILEIGCILFSIFFLAFGMERVVPSLWLTPENTFPETEEYIASAEEKTFALSRASYLLLRNDFALKEPMLIEKNEAFEKCVYFGSPYYAHPSYLRLLAKAGIQNLYTDLAEVEDLYFVDNRVLPDIDKMITYLNEEYGADGEYRETLVHEVEEFRFYQIEKIEK